MPECPEKVQKEQLDEISKKIKRETDASPQTGRRQMLLDPSGTLNTIAPCAACKLLRRRCARECPFSPYFSPHEPHKFASVHKVFGASNVSKMLMEVPESQRADAASSLVYEANVRLRDPVYGCMGAILTLQQQVQYLQAELNALRGEIMKYKYNEQSISVHSPNVALLFSGDVSVSTAPLQAPTSLPQPSPLPLHVPDTSSSSYKTQATSNVDYSTITHEHGSYFG